MSRFAPVRSSPVASHEHGDPLARINDDHAEQLLVAVRTMSDLPEATAAAAVSVDPSGLDLVVSVPGGERAARLDFLVPIGDEDYPAGTRVAFVRLIRHAQAQAAAVDR